MFDTDSKFGQKVYQLLEEQGESVELKASFFMNGREGDIIGFESADNLYQEPEYRIVESLNQVKSEYNIILQNLSQIEGECDLKNALEICHVAICFKVGDIEVNFIFLPVFPKNFRISENYSSWVQLKSILKSGDAGSPSRGTAISSFFKHKLVGAKTNFLLYVESSPEKFVQSTTILDETTRLITELRSNFASRSRHEESIENSRQQLSERSSHYQNAEELDLYSKQVVQEINNFLLHAEDILDSSEKTPGILRPQGEELKRQIEILEQKVEIANESSKSSKLRQKLINSQNKLSQLRDTIDFILTASRKETMRTPPTARMDTTDRQNLLHSTKKPVYSSPRNGTAIGLPPKSIAHTKKKSIEYEGIKKFNSENYKGTLL